MQVAEKTKQEQQDTIKVLIADDDPPTRMLLRSAIAQWGYEVIEASDGEEAWEILQKADAPRLLIVDWLMPKLDGISLCQRIKERSLSHPYIILLTQVTGTTNIVKGLEAGADEFLSKPFNMAELRSRLSVGARIKKFEKLLDERSKELQNYTALIEKIFCMIDGLTKKINDMAGSNQDSECTDKIQDLKSGIESLTGALKSLNVNQKSEGK